MRTTVIPAQITTVEDKIAGNLNLTQIILLILPVAWITFVYTALPPRYLVSIYKIPLALSISLVFIILSLRVRGKVVLSWLLVLLRFNLRPKYYVFNKNDSFTREMYLPVFEKKKIKLFSFSKKETKSELKIPAKSFDLKDLMDLRGFINNPEYSLSLKPDSKGGLYVALKQK